MDGKPRNVLGRPLYQGQLVLRLSAPRTNVHNGMRVLYKRRRSTQRRQARLAGPSQSQVGMVHVDFRWKCSGIGDSSGVRRGRQEMVCIEKPAYFSSLSLSLVLGHFLGSFMMEGAGVVLLLVSPLHTLHCSSLQTQCHFGLRDAEGSPPQDTWGSGTNTDSAALTAGGEGREDRSSVDAIDCAARHLTTHNFFTPASMPSRPATTQPQKRRAATVTTVRTLHQYAHLQKS